ncbi:putative lipase esterase from carbohydrate esterase family ce10 [Moniliophthora roreri MCA 2997]|uniref:Lipase esterase from carbohydrate esterase family ce10 n=2 Tax=Moniliophthora roreri TaxID=221103 RepID=V2XIN8_MONRO|nr:putative lipase esterase from carbohydrate esterase family ce10 [Moniliophthora roreri MCA 2997]KAI3622677.1 putative lipase esterase from carbohydrate esterase family ce10 [Moniliophthora roreri]
MTVTLPWPFNKPGATPERSQDNFEHSRSQSDDPKRSLNAFLTHYSTPGISPPSARIDSKLKIQERRPIRPWHLWKYGLLAATKTTELTLDLLSYQIWGPRKKSWGLEMTIINSLMRGAGRHSALVDITTIRLLMGLGGLIPLPSDALVTPVSFRVRKRNLRGILAEFDALENGTRYLSGEWVVGRKTWQKRQAEWEAEKSGESSADGAKSPRKSGKSRERVILYIHGGAYYVSSAAAQRMISIPLSKYTDSRVFALDYRLAPETRFPGPLHDAASAYFRLVEDLLIPPENIVLAGDSAGGGLCLALLMYLRDNKYPLPSAAILMSPWVDLTMSCESWDSNAPYDVVPIPAPDDHLNPVALYLGDNMEQYMTHPYASPLFGDFRGLPPLLIQAGDSEVLRDEITLLTHKATLAGVNVRHELYEDAIHVFQLYPFLEATARSFVSMRDFLRRTLPHVHKRAPQLLNMQTVRTLEREIENERVTIVRGDGVETGAGMDEVKETAQFTTESSSDTDDDSERKSKAYASWGRCSGSSSSSWYICPDTEDEGDEDDDDESRKSKPTSPITPSSANVSPHRRRRAGTLPSASGFGRIRSAMSVIMQDSPPAYPQCRGSPTGLSSRRAAPPKMSLPSTPMSAAMSSTRSIPPSPSIRRSSRATSHHDISNLVREWTSTGPANRTVLYTPHA